ncbi:MAG TPA: hypothetical protein VHX38_25775 [Pseudonocardiaceae bacterium]|jgi:hypothetical protein|nr:hypothetical protein [Pseudonocardiaceae bacterium]
MDAEEESILRQMIRINESSGQLATLMLTGEATQEDQINFAHKLIDLAETIRDRVAGPVGIVIEGSVVDDSATTGGDTPGTSRDA